MAVNLAEKAAELRQQIVNLPRSQRRVYESKTFVGDYDIISGGVDFAPEKNCFKLTIIAGQLKQGKQFEDIADYWDYVIKYLADKTKPAGWKVNALFCFHYTYALHYLSQKQYPKEYAALYASIQKLAELAISECPKTPMYILAPYEGEPLSETLKKYNCVTLTDRIFRDIKVVEKLRNEFWPHGEEGMFRMNYCGGIIIKNPIR